jgi:hypothetical protein
VYKPFRPYGKRKPHMIFLIEVQAFFLLLLPPVGRGPAQRSTRCINCLNSNLVVNTNKVTPILQLLSLEQKVGLNKPNKFQDPDKV